ncbi:methyl-accepting chemotaxis protein [Neptunicella marina]|uniref:Methyl-accepting chemotaxis protein n=1 Tax=Neptunicella marina TaxID=2125989 RepID=A0A8J6ITJ6_9ALTE|nr:methyl-accepting chemotaxis protein [Neptunicella marina]MBC3765148.1 methyl-accepting chemotaxis protein [Neptunicella marina]
MNSIYSRLSLRGKIMGISVLINSLLITSSFYALWAMGTIGNELKNVAQKDIKITERFTQLTMQQLAVNIEFERVAHYGALRQSMVQQDKAFDTALSQFAQRNQQIEPLINEIQHLITQSMHGEVSDTTEYRGIDTGLQYFIKLRKQFNQQAAQVINAYKTGAVASAETGITELEGISGQIDLQLEAVLENLEHFTFSRVEAAQAREQHSVYFMIALVLLSLLIGFAMSYFIANKIVMAIRQTITTASGDLTKDIEVNASDEIGELQQAMNSMRRRLLDMLDRISNTTEQLSVSAEQMSQVTRDTSKNIDIQHQETEQIASAITQMSATAQQVAVNVNQTATAAFEATKATKQSSDIVVNAIEQINRLAKQVEVSATTISEVEQQSDTINSVLDVIKGIADQTNLLALNAAIEAARAGEQGRGFAVVADEVRTLAGRTQTSTDEINSMIEQLQQRSMMAVKVMQDSQREAEKAVSLSQDTRHALHTISSAVEKINLNADQIASAATQQGPVAEEINTNIIKLNELSHQNTQGAEETATATDELNRMASELQNIVGAFKTG